MHCDELKISVCGHLSIIPMWFIHSTYLPRLLLLPLGMMEVSFPSFTAGVYPEDANSYKDQTDHCEGSVLNKNRGMHSTVWLMVSLLVGMQGTYCSELSGFHLVCFPQPCPTITWVGMLRVPRGLVGRWKVEHSRALWRGFRGCQGQAVTLTFLCLFGTSVR